MAEKYTNIMDNERGADSFVTFSKKMSRRFPLGGERRLVFIFFTVRAMQNVYEVDVCALSLLRKSPRTQAAGAA